MASFSFRKYRHNPEKSAYRPQGIDVDKKLVQSLSKSKIPNLKQLKYIGRYLNRKERKILQISGLVLIISLAFWSFGFYRDNVNMVPVRGGDYVEGLVGFPRFVNPLYAGASDVDSDISRLVFSSLFSHDKYGHLTTDLAESYEVSEDSKIYTIKLREDAKWHNGGDVTSQDVLFTFNAIKDVNFKSPLRNSFMGVDLERIDEYNLRFVLEEPYAAFLEFLTFGIVPESLWMQIPPETVSLAELNLKPIGSGPYKFKSLIKDRSGVIKSYNLILNEDYYRDSGYIQNITFKFFPSADEMIMALNEKNIDGVGYLSKQAREKIVSPSSLWLHELSLPNLTAVFFNQKNNESLANLKARQALALATSQKSLIENVFQGGAEAIYGPILPGNFAYKEDLKKYEQNLEEAEKLLQEIGWSKREISEEAFSQATAILESQDEEVDKKEAEIISEMGVGVWLYDSKKDDYFRITLSTVDNADNILAVTEIKRQWEELGVKTELNIVSAGEIQSGVIRPRNFEALFYGQVVGNDPDVYVFWHSSQANAGGLNLANYSNSEVDKLLEEARVTADQEERIEKYHKFQEKIAEDLPAIFLYSPLYIYAQSRKVQGFDIESILRSSDRFNNVTEWYLKTGRRISW